MSDTSAAPKLSDFEFIAFDVYATLIDWETGFYNALLPMLKSYKVSSTWTREESLEAFHSVEKDLQGRFPDMKYSELVGKASEVLEERIKAQSDIPSSESATTLEGTPLALPASELQIAFGQSIREFSLFPDTHEALQRLSKYYKLCVLSNTDNVTFGYTLATLSEGKRPSELEEDVKKLYTYPSPNPDLYWFPKDVEGSRSPITLIMTAQDVGTYKPDHNGFLKAIETIQTDKRLLGKPGGTEAKGKLLWVAQSIYHDIIPANTLGIKTVWIDREKVGPQDSDGVKPDWRFETLGEMADAVEKERAQK